MTRIPVAIALLFLVMPTLCHAGSPDEWQFEVSPYLWAVGKDGRTGVKNVRDTGVDLIADVDLSFSDILENLDMALLVNGQAQKGPWGIRMDFVHMTVSTGTTVNAARAELEVSETAWTTALFYKPERWKYFDVFAGFRLIDANTEIDIIGAMGRSAGTDIGDTWVDPIVGVNFQYPLNEKWGMILRADMGGFGVGSDFTWQGTAAIRYRVSDLIILDLAYRYFEADYEEDGYVYDLSTEGPLLGVTFAF
ncbi:hypothetical protein [Desulfosediminicola sp.]|uniref:hypothetical protein n=1 Tax=Desulfosediminicola sp. TaxID=2886825 RepID=UPI003AF1F831